MTEEDEEFNRIERESAMRKESVKDTIRYRDAFPKDYALPKPWVGLTDEELEEFSNAKLGSYDLCLEVEAKLKEKNDL